MDRIDKGEIYKWFNLFVDWKENPLVEIRIGGHGKGMYSGYFKDPDSIIEWVEKYDTNNIYFAINPLDPQCEHLAQFNKILERPAKTTNDKDIIGRDWVFIDIDPIRMPDINATEEEAKYAKDVARRVVRYLKSEGLSDPVVAFSANGVHLYYRCNMANDDSTNKVVTNFLKALGNLFDDDKVKIDTAVANASRIAKLPGTMSAKGRPDDTERPQRMCRILTVPTEVVPTDVAYFAKVASLVPEPAKPSKENDWGRKKFDLREFMQKYGIEVKQEVRAAGGTRFILDHCVFNPDHKAKDAMIFQYDDGTIAYKCLHASCSQYKWRDVRLLFDPEAYSSREDVADFAYKRRMQGREKKPFVPQEESQEKGPIWLSLDEIPTLNPDDVVSIATGIKELDDKIFGGTILQQLSIMTGRPASGKSTILNTILLSSIQQGFPTAIFSGELPNQLLKSWITLPAAGRSYVKQSFKRNNSYYVPKDVEDKILAWLKEKLFVHNAEYGNNWEQLKGDIVKIVEKGAKNIILDNLMTIDLDYEFDSAQYRAQKEFINELHNMARRLNIHIWLVAHPRKQTVFLRMVDIAGSGDLINLADNIFIVHRVNQDFESQAKAFIPKPKLEAIKLKGYTNVVEIVKNRLPGLYIDDLVGVYYEPESKRMKNDVAEVFQYGWDSTPVQMQLPIQTQPVVETHSEAPEQPWYNKDQDDGIDF